MNPFDTPAFQQSVARRAFLQQSAYGLGGMAFTSMLDKANAGDHWTGALKK